MIQITKETGARKRATAIIIKEGKVLLIYRNKKGKEYYIFPGGGIEENESPEEALLRECKEELAVEVRVGSLCKEFLDPSINHYVYAYFCDIISSNETVSWQELQTLQNIYEAVWIPLTELSTLPILPEALLPAITEADFSL